MKVKLKTITPLHIGNGNELREVLDYVIIQNKFKRINFKEVFLNSKLEDKFKENSDPNLLKDDFINYLKSSKKTEKEIFYELPIETSSSNISTEKRIYEMGKLINEGFYIPGSSIKGAIRTIILWSIYENHEDKNFKNLVDKWSLAKALEKRIKLRKDSKDIKTIEKELKVESKKSVILMNLKREIRKEMESIANSLHNYDQKFKDMILSLCKSIVVRIILQKEKKVDIITITNLKKKIRKKLIEVKGNFSEKDIDRLEKILASIEKNIRKKINNLGKQIKNKFDSVDEIKLDDYYLEAILLGFYYKNIHQDPFHGILVTDTNAIKFEDGFIGGNKRLLLADKVVCLREYIQKGAETIFEIKIPSKYEYLKENETYPKYNEKFDKIVEEFMKEEPQEFVKIANEFTKKKLESLEKYLNKVEKYLVSGKGKIIENFLYGLYNFKHDNDKKLVSLLNKHLLQTLNRISLRHIIKKIERKLNDNGELVNWLKEIQNGSVNIQERIKFLRKICNIKKVGSIEKRFKSYFKKVKGMNNIRHQIKTIKEKVVFLRSEIEKIEEGNKKENENKDKKRFSCIINLGYGGGDWFKKIPYLLSKTLNLVETNNDISLHGFVKLTFEKNSKEEF